MGEVFDRSKMYARSFNGARLGVKHNGVTPWAQMTGLPEANLLDNTRQDALNWFADRVGENGLDDPQRIRLLDYAGRPLLLSETTVTEHLEPQYIKQGRQNLIKLIPEILSDPDEVYIRPYRGVYNFMYIKFYKGLPMVVPTGVKEDTPAAISSWFQLRDPDGERNGILIYKK